MAFYVRIPGNTRQGISTVRVRDVGGALRVIQIGRVRDAGNVMRTFFNGLIVTVSPATVTGFGGTTAASKVITSSVATATVTGGLAPLTYAWALVTGASSGITATSPTSASTTFSATVDRGDEVFAVFECLVTDASGAKKYGHVNVSLTCEDWN